MINGLILVPKNEEYLKEKPTVQIAVDTISMFPAASQVVILREQSDMVEVRVVKCNNDVIKTKYMYISPDLVDDIIKIIAHGRLKGRITALLYKTASPLSNEVLSILNKSLTTFNKGVFRKMVSDDIQKAVNAVGSSDFQIEPLYVDQFMLTVNEKQFTLLDMGHCVYLSPNRDKSLNGITKINNTPELLAAVTKKKNRVIVDDYKEKVTLNDGTIIVFSRLGANIIEVIKPSNKEAATHEYSHPGISDPLESWIEGITRSPQVHTSTNVSVPSKALEAVTRNENKALSGVVNVKPEGLIGDTSNLKVSNNDDASDMLQNVAVEVSDARKQMFITAHQAGETDVKAYANVSEEDKVPDNQDSTTVENTEPKIYPNITEEDAMPDVYTGDPMIDSRFINILNHYKVDGTDAEKEIVSIIESKSINGLDLKDILSKGSYDRFVSLQGLTKVMSKYSIQRLTDFIKE